MRIILIFFVITVLTISCSSSRETSRREDKAKKKIEKIEALKDLLENKNYEFTAQHALPMGGGHIDLTTNYNFVRVKGDSLDIYMPFFGTSYMVEYGKNGAIKATGTPDSYKLIPDKNEESFRIEFRIHGKNDVYDMSIDASYSGFGTLSIISTKRSFISYWGKVQELQIQEK